MKNDEQRRKNLRTAGIVFSAALVFLVGFVAKIVLFCGVGQR